MDRRSLVLVGVTLVLLGVLSLAFTVILSLFGLSPGRLLLRMWPLVVIGLGLLFVVPPFLVRDKPGLGALFIPGFPVLMTGAILFLASVSNDWGIWGWLWPMLILSLASGFFFAAIYARVIWLLVPAIIIGLNALAFQFCALTGLWGWWAVLWIIEPLAAGLALLAANVKVRSPALSIAGLILCGLAASGFLLMITVLGAWWPAGLLGPVVLILAGLALLALGMARHLLVPRVALKRGGHSQTVWRPTRSDLRSHEGHAPERPEARPFCTTGHLITPALPIGPGPGPPAIPWRALASRWS